MSTSDGGPSGILPELGEGSGHLVQATDLLQKHVCRPPGLRVFLDRLTVVAAIRMGARGFFSSWATFRAISVQLRSFAAWMASRRPASRSSAMVRRAFRRMENS